MKIVFTDNLPRERLYPITLTRRPCDILCGGATLAALAERFLTPIPLKKTLVLDSALLPSAKKVKALAVRIKAGRPAKASWPRFEKLWEVITWNQKLLRSNLEELYGPGIRRGKNVTVAKNVTFDADAGPIVLGDNVRIAPFVHLVGPLYIGPGSVVNEFTVLKGGTCLGPVCKVGGELDATIMQGYGNKQHQGVLAYSYAGEWVNLGGGTSNSDLKNTYGQVKMAGKKTGELFLGCVIGDHTKTAINTSIFTGKVIGVNSALYGFVTRDVPSFTNWLGTLGEHVEFSLDEAIKVQKIVMARRRVKQTKADRELLKRVFEMTAGERKEAGVKKGMLMFN